MAVIGNKRSVFRVGGSNLGIISMTRPSKSASRLPKWLKCEGPITQNVSDLYAAIESAWAALEYYKVCDDDGVRARKAQRAIRRLSK